MFYEEKIINGVLCYRNDPAVEHWRICSPIAITRRLIAEYAEALRLRCEIVELKKELAGDRDGMREQFNEECG